MIDDANEDELIEHYLLNKTSGVRLDDFNERLATDDQLKREVTLQKAIIQNIKVVGRNEWASKLKDIHNEMDLSSEKDELTLPKTNGLKPIRSLFNKKYFLSAAAAIVIIILSALYLTKYHKPDTNNIFISYYKPYPSLEQNTRSLPSDTLTEKQEAFQAYNEGSYDKSIKLFRSILAKSENEEVFFYLGNACLSANNATEAENIFKKYLNKYKEFSVESKWYLTLSYLKQGKVEDAKKLLQEIAAENIDYSKNAREILGKL